MPDDEDGLPPDVSLEDDLADVVPTALSQRRERAEPTTLRAHSFASLMYRRVHLRVHGFDVTGEFRGADEDDVYVRGELRWFVYPIASVTSLTVLDEPDDDDDDG